MDKARYARSGVRCTTAHRSGRGPRDHRECPRGRCYKTKSPQRDSTVLGSRADTRPHRHVRRRTSDVARRAGEHAGESAVACGGVMGGRARAVGQYAVNIVARAGRGRRWGLGQPRWGLGWAPRRAVRVPCERCVRVFPTLPVPACELRPAHDGPTHLTCTCACTCACTCTVHLYGHGHGPPPPTTIHVHSTYSACLYIATSSAINQALSKNHINLTNRPPR